MKGFKAALFDLDGTLMDSEGYYTSFWTEISKDMLPDIPDLGIRARGISPSVTMAKFFPDEKDREIVRRRMKQWDENLPCTMYDGAMEFVACLRANGVKCALVTSSLMPKMQLVYSRVPGFKESFDLILTSEDFTRPKPAPDCYLKASGRLGVLPEECVVFEDSDAGLKSGHDAGMFTFGLATECQIEEIAPKCDCALSGFAGLDYESVMGLIAPTLNLDESRILK